MAIGLLLSASKFLGGAISKAASPNAKNTATVDKGGEDGGGKPGAIVKSEKVSITPTSPMVGSGVVSTSATPTKVSKPKGKVSFSSISNQLDSMVALTSMIDTVTQKNTEGQKNVSELARKSKEKQKKKDREEKSESGGVLGFLGSKAKKAGNKFGISNFFTSILLGIGALALINLTKKLSKGFDGLGDVFGGITQGFKIFGLTIAAVVKEFPNLLTKGKNLLSKVKLGDRLKKLGTGLKNVFKSLGNKLIPGFIKKAVGVVKNTLTTARNLGRAGLEAVRRGLTFDTRTKLPGATNKGLNKLLNNVGRNVGRGSGGRNLGIGDGFRKLPGGSGRITNTLSKKTLQIRAQHGDEAARMYQQALDSGKSSKRALANVNKAISSGRLTSQPVSGLRGIEKSQLVKGGVKQTLKRTSIKLLGKGMTKFLGRVPVIGALLVGIFTLLEDLEGGGIDEDGNPIPDGKPDFNLAKGVLAGLGAGIGGAIGTGIMPIVGTVLGEFIGEYIGGLFYAAISGGGLGAIKKKLIDDVKGVFTMGQKAVDWVTTGFNRLYEGLPKFNVWPFGEIPDVRNVFKDPGMVGKAFFTDEPMKKGKVEKKDEEKPTEASDSPQYFDSGDGKYYYMAEDGAIYYVGASEEEAKRNSAAGIHPRDPDQEIEPVEDSTSGANLETTRVMGKPVLTSSYGKMRAGGPHGGTDIAADLGAPLVPVTDATIVDYGKLSLTGAKRGDPSGWGNFIVYKDSQGYYHLYGHVLEDGMKTSGSVKKGVPIAKVGSTGRSSGPHLHWEMGTSWSGGTLGGKMDPLSVYRVEDPFTVGGRMSDNSPTKEIKKSTKPEPKREDFGSGRSGAKKYAEALKAYKAEMQSQPEISPQTSPSASVSGVESQASYEQTGGGSTVVLAAPQQQSSGGGGGSSGGGGVMRVGSGDVLNSYYRAQLLGFLYKQG